MNFKIEEDLELHHARHMTNLALAAGFQGGRIRLPKDYRKSLDLIERDNLTIDSCLGSGAFGEVSRVLMFNIALKNVFTQTI